jgi:hypothetical protein
VSFLCLEGETETIECFDMLFSKGLFLGAEELTSLAQTARNLNRLSIAKCIE